MPAEKAQNLHRIIAILDCFTQDTPKLGVREVSRRLGLSSSAVGRLMQALRDQGVLNQEQGTALYSMGARVLAWSGVYTSTLDVRNLALPALHELHEVTMETISLYVLEGVERVCVERLESPLNVRLVPRLGRRLPLYAGSGGKVMLAFLPVERQEEILNAAMVPLTPNTIVDPQALRHELQIIHAQGYSVSHGEWLMDAAGVGAPIFDQTGAVIAALTISGPIQRFTVEKVKEYIPAVLRVARQISQEMGYYPEGVYALNRSYQNPNWRQRE